MRKLGRSLLRSLIVDNLSENFSYTKENGLEIGEWKGDKEDEQLLVLKDWLIDIANRVPPI